MASVAPQASEHLAFLSGGGRLGEIIANFDWAATPLSAIPSWPQSLKTTVALILRSPVPIVTLWGADGVMLYNDAYAGFAGGRHPQLLGSKVREGWPEVADFNDNVMQVGLGGGTLAYRDQELTLNRSGVPEQVWMNLDYSPIIGEDGTPAGVIAIVSETSSKIRAERRLDSERAMFRTLAQAMPNQVWASPASGVLDWFNEQVYAYSGAQPGELDGGRWTEIVHPDDVPAAGQKWVAAIETGNTYEMEFRLRRADGVYRWHLARALPIRDEAGAIVRWVGTNTDIEDQKKVADTLANLNEMLELQVSLRTAERDRMWRLSNDIMLVADFGAHVIAVNPAFVTLLDWDESAVIGRSFMDFVHPDDRATTLAELALLGQGVQTFKFENRYQHRDGSYRILAWSAAPDHEFVHAVGRDVTVEREHAQAMKRTEQALQQAQKMETIGKLTGGVAHDFNNLLQVISGNLQLLAADVVGNSRAQKRVENAMGGVARGAKLASHLLAFGRRQALEPKVVKIGRYVAAMEDMLHRTLGEAIEVETVISAGLWNMLADTAQVENALLNLCINARDAMDGVGKLTIEVGNAMLDESYAREHVDVVPGHYVMIAVTDTGSGMSPEVLRQAFEPFFSTKPEGKGTGLGLSMVYGFVKQSGGHVNIYSEVGSGTAVKLYLPRSMEAEDIVAGADTRPVTGGAETILVAEDDEGVRGTVVEMLGDLGYRVLQAGDAASALAIINSGMRIDLLFTDVVMPGPLRSPDLARKARERLPQLAVLFTSGYTENAIVHGGRLDAGVELLGKPYTRAALAQKIRHVLANQKQRSGGPAVPESARAANRDAPPAKPAGLKLLLVEDDETVRLNTAELLELLGHSVLHAGDAETALGLLGLAPVDVLITDIELPGVSGEVLAARARAVAPKLGIVFASGRDHAARLEGAAQLRKPYDVPSIVAALKAAMDRP